MKVRRESDERFKAFINIADNNSDISVKKYNKAANKLLDLIESEELSIHYFTGKNGKLIIGFK